jgi:hypothetical protein
MAGAGDVAELATIQLPSDASAQRTDRREWLALCVLHRSLGDAAGIHVALVYYLEVVL